MAYFYVLLSCLLCVGFTIYCFHGLPPSTRTLRNLWLLAPLVALATWVNKMCVLSYTQFSVAKGFPCVGHW